MPQHSAQDRLTELVDELRSHVAFEAPQTTIPVAVTDLAILIDALTAHVPSVALDALATYSFDDGDLDGYDADTVFVALDDARSALPAHTALGNLRAFSFDHPDASDVDADSLFVRRDDVRALLAN